MGNTKTNIVPAATANFNKAHQALLELAEQLEKEQLPFMRSRIVRLASILDEQHIDYVEYRLDHHDAKGA